MRAAIVAGIVVLAAPLVSQVGVRPPVAFAPSASDTHLVIATSHSVAVVKPGAVVSLFVDVAPNRGIHVYAPGAKDYRPIAVKLDPDTHVRAGKLIYPTSEILLFEPLGERVPTYQKPFRLTQDVTILNSVKPGATIALTGTVNYQACDDKVCFVPASVPVSWTVDVR